MTRSDTAPEQPKHFRLRLYNADRSADTLALAKRLENAVETAFGGSCVVEVIDVLSDPEQAAFANVFATPMLVKELPAPLAKVFGNLDDTHKVLALLGFFLEK